MSAATRHVRTRTGCWTCRFRKKKCDEARPACEQCSHLRLTCDGYDAQPIWMKDVESAAQKKHEIKKQMVRRSRRRKRNQDPNKASGPPQKAANPPAKKGPSDDEDDSKIHSIPLSPPRQFPGVAIPILPDEHEYHNVLSISSPEESASSDYPVFSMRGWGSQLPDTRNPGSVRTVSSRALSPTTSGYTYSSRDSRGASMDYVIKDEQYEDEDTDIPDSALSPQTPTDLVRRRDPSFRISRTQFSDLQIPTEKPLDLNLANLYLRTIFGVTYRFLSDEQVGQYHGALVVPMFHENKSFLHGCLSSTALHLTGTNISEPQRKGLVVEVYRHRQKSLKSLQEQVQDSESPEQRVKIAATICALISFQVFSRRTDWQIHVKAATDCVVLLNWCHEPPTHPGQWFVYSRVLWLDILSSITSGQPPVFASYYNKLLFLPPDVRDNVNKLYELTGCNDSILYLISDITCLEVWKFGTIDAQPWPLIQEELARRAEVIDRQLRELTTTGLKWSNTGTETENFNFPLVQSPLRDEEDIPSDPDFGDDDLPDSDFEDIANLQLDDFDEDRDPSPEINEMVSSIVRRDSSGTGLSSYYKKEIAVSSPTETDRGDVFVLESTDQLIEDRQNFRKAVTEAFRIMARVYLRIVAYGFKPYEKESQDLLEEFLAVINFIPSLYMGYERSIISPLLIVGSLAISQTHQQVISTRLKKTLQMAKYGNLGNVDKILTEVWSRNWNGEPWQIVPWRQVMKEKNWEYLMV